MMESKPRITDSLNLSSPILMNTPTRSPPLTDQVGPLKSPTILFPRSPSGQFFGQEKRERPSSRASRRTSLQSNGSAVGGGGGGVIPHSHPVEDVSSLKRQLQELKQQLALSRACQATMEKAQRAAATLSPPSGPSRRNTSHANNATSAHSRENGYFPTSPSSGFKSIPHSSPMFDLKRKVSEEGGLRSPFEIGGDRRVTEKQVEVLDGWIAQDSGVQEGDVDGNTLNDLSSLGLNRIPQSHVQTALSLHPPPPTLARTSGGFRAPSRSPSAQSLRSHSPLLSPSLPPPIPDLPHPCGPSPRSARKFSSNSSSKVIDGLQREVDGLRASLDRVKGDLRTSQRVVSQLTRQTEDLKETKERMRNEADSLNNVINRKERLLQEVLDRARTAESTAAILTKDRKSLEQTTKKQLQSMTTQLNEAQYLGTKSERESAALREGVKSMKEQWGREVKSLREEIRVSGEKAKKEREEMQFKQTTLNKLLQAQSTDRANLSSAESTLKSLNASILDLFTPKLDELARAIDEKTKQNEEVLERNRAMEVELARFRRMMRSAAAENGEAE